LSKEIDILVVKEQLQSVIVRLVNRNDPYDPDLTHAIVCTRNAIEALDSIQQREIANEFKAQALALELNSGIDS